MTQSALVRKALSYSLALLIGFSGGLGGGFVAVGLDRSDHPLAELDSSPPVTTSVRSAVERALPAIVAVVADMAPERLADGRVLERQTIGSGVVLSDAGHVMTNFHVIDGAQKIRIVLATGEQRPAVTLSDDSPFTDLAVLLVPPKGLRTADFGNSGDLRPGDTVLAIARGRLSDAHETVTAGVVSGIGRAWARNGIILEDLVQTDASVNAGDSGGALINLDGEFVGLLTTVVRTDGSGRSVHGVSFAQSSNSLRPVFERIVEQGSYPRARLGIERPLHHHLEISPSLALEQDLPVEFGALVVNTESGSPADDAGVRAGDIIVSVNGSAVDFNNPLPNLLKRLTVGTDAELLLVRNGEEVLITISPWVN